MDFFTQQDNARRMTRRLVILFVLAVIAVVVAVNLAAVYFFGWDVSAHVVISLITLAVIVGGSLFRVLQLRSGGTAVAEMVGGRRVRPDTVDLDERRLLNIVEEMAIASGISVPIVYVLDHESGINAFAAGYSPNEAVVAVTRGTLKQLNREELQGVIGHEFSHILNGDMRLNIRMIGVLAGILLIAEIGYFIMRSTEGRSSSSSKKDSNSSIFLFGLALFAIGYVGKFFADVIKAAVSRQREFLADASAVQFTRNPEGIGRALIKIGEAGSQVEAASATELSHMFFARGVKLADLFATHPPLEERVDRVLGPGRAREMRRSVKVAPASEGALPASNEGLLGEAAMGFGRAMPRGPVGLGTATASTATTADAVLATVGNPTARHVTYAEMLLAALPPALRERIGSEVGAKAGLFALLLQDTAARDEKRRLVAEAGEGEALALAELAVPTIERLGARARLPILDLATPAIKSLPADERGRLLSLVRKLVHADGRIDAMEFVLLAILARQLDDAVSRAQVERFRSLEPLAPQIAVVVSMFVRAASQGSLLFEQAMGSLGLAGQRLTPASALDYEVIQLALIDLKGLTPLKKPLVIKACLDVVMADGKVAVLETELMRAVCAMLDSPMPPMLEQE